MLWFKHFSDARQHPKFKKLEKIFGHTGYSIPFKTFEIIAQYGGKTLKLSLKKYGMSEISEDFKITKGDLLRIWEEMMEMHLLSKKWFNKGYLYSSKLKEYQDNYTKSVAMGWRDSNDRVATKYSIEQNRIDKNRKEKNRQQLNDLKKTFNKTSEFPKEQ